MRTAAMGLPEHDQSNSEIEGQLQRILADPSFQSAPQLSKLLTYLVEKALAGQADELKATAIAKAVFRRDDSLVNTHQAIIKILLPKCLFNQMLLIPGLSCGFL